jgi:hypothetical protein
MIVLFYLIFIAISVAIASQSQQLCVDLGLVAAADDHHQLDAMDCVSQMRRYLRAMTTSLSMSIFHFIVLLIHPTSWSIYTCTSTT